MSTRPASMPTSDSVSARRTPRRSDTNPPPNMVSVTTPVKNDTAKPAAGSEKWASRVRNSVSRLRMPK